MQLRYALEIDAPAERVWAVLRDVEAWPEWNPTVHRVSRIDPEPFAVGRRYRITQPNLPVAEWTVTELSPGRSFTWQSERLGARVRGRHLVVATRGRSVLMLELEFLGPLGIVAGYLTRRLCERYLRLEASALKRRSELNAASVAVGQGAARRGSSIAARRPLPPRASPGSGADWPSHPRT